MKKVILMFMTLLSAGTFSASSIACVETWERPRPEGVVIKSDGIYYDNKKVDTDVDKPKILKKKYDIENFYRIDNELKLNKPGDEDYKPENNEYFVTGGRLYYKNYQINKNNYKSLAAVGQIRYSTGGRCSSYTVYNDIIKADNLYIINGNTYASINKYISDILANENVELLYIMLDKRLTVYNYFDNGSFMNNYVYNTSKNMFIADGVQEVRDKNYKIIDKTIFKNGTGYMKVYDESLTLVEEGKYENSKRVGDWKLY
ncbi:hypothetical protein [Sebaldella sp. S0638]|uniref:hypothetical protein n=1 Tax=Sebaldella sp. S0638 TaxID=2957809 RepID=UPI00209CB7AE|nr:hypothetical protein [Sebaldella sp. S0638]MCP1222860.1 hypothetical protein [Sebaldella sp. S0638]